MNLVKIDPDGSILVQAKDVIEAKLVLKELKLHKKTFNLQKKQTNEQMRQIRAQYTDQIRRQGSKMRGGGWIGKIVRSVQTAKRDDNRYNLASALAPYEQQKQRIEQILSNIEQSILKVEYYIHQNQ